MLAPARPSCFHCAGPIDSGCELTVDVAGEQRPVCCRGCEAAARVILGQGLGRFYEFRDVDGATRADDGQDWSTFDRDAALRRYSHLDTNGNRELSLLVDGLHCSACAWLIQTSLGRMDGVGDVQVNSSTARAQLRFDPRQQRLSAILERVAALGFTPRPLSFTSEGEDWSHERRQALKRLGVAGFGMMAVMTYAASLYAGGMDGMKADMANLLRLASMVVATPVVLYAAQPFFLGAWRSLRSGTFGMDVPVALSIGSAYLWSLVTTARGAGEVYFDSAVMFTFFLLLGRFIEMSLRHHSGQHSDALAGLLPSRAHKLANADVQEVLPEELLAGDQVRVLPGERLPADGTVLLGATEIDESLLTGESAPRPCTVGCRVVAGTVNVGSAIDMVVTQVGQDSTLASVSRLLDRAAADRPRIALVADRIAGWFVGAILLFAVVVGWYWWQVAPARAFPAMLAVLVVTCPCALSLATPAALAAATTRLARAGLLVTRGRAIERLARADRMMFDKTGTLTRGQPIIQRITALRPGVNLESCLAMAASIERHSEHPLARAFSSAPATVTIDDIHTVPGQGMTARHGDETFKLGKPSFVGTAADVVAATDSAQSVVWLGDGRGPMAAFYLSDGLRHGACALLTQLPALGMQPLIASGDQPAVVADVAQRLGGIEALGHLTAVEKLAWARTLQQQGHTVAMVGDGVNDAPVLAGADVSIAVGSGTELAKVSADVILVGAGLSPILTAVHTARRTVSIIRQNLWWSVLYNAAAIPLAACGILKPWMAAVGMSTSSLVVVLNATRLLQSDAATAVAPTSAGTAAAAPQPAPA